MSLLEPETTTVLLGPSGAGKSTLVNALLGIERQEVGAVRASDGRGRHTTVTRELLTLPNGALLIDTPGIREAGLWDGTGGAFADIEALALQCRFTDCGHTNEPSCVVREQAEPDRVEAWKKLEREQAWLEDRRQAARERKRIGKQHARTASEARRAKGDVHRPERSASPGGQPPAAHEVQADDAVRPRRVPRPARDVLAAQRRVRILLGHDVADLLTLVGGAVDATRL